MKKVGILTFHSVLNYGSALQAIALQNAIEDLGLDVEIIDYRPEPHVEKKDFKTVFRKTLKISVWKKRIKYMFFKFKVGFDKQRMKRIDRYERFFENNMKLSKQCKTKQELKEISRKYDFLVCGSDQIWNPNYLDGDFSYFLDFCNDKEKKIAYAPSIAVECIESKYREEFITAVRDFKYISVREESSVNLLKNLANVECKTVLDPTMLANFDIWKKYEARNVYSKPYILSYFLGNNTDYQEAVLALSESTGLEILNIPHMHLWSAMEYYNFGNKRLVDVGPAEFLSLIKYAEYVCTDSFHGSVFSILYEKKFFTFKRYKDTQSTSENSRIYTLLDMLGLQDRLVYHEKEIKCLKDKNIDYLNVKKIINKKKEESRQFLINAFRL